MKTTPCKCISVILFFCLSCLLLNGCNSQTAGQQSADQANQEAQRQEVSFIIAEKTALTDFSELPGRLNSLGGTVGSCARGNFASSAGRYGC